MKLRTLIPANYLPESVNFDSLPDQRQKQFYTGAPLESGGTSIPGKEVEALKHVISAAGIKSGMKVLDYGAGKFARNADYLRNLGVETYAYDPFNGTSDDGWGLGTVTKKKPTERFDIGFTSYVLNVVPKEIENEIIADVKRFAERSYHITRDLDIFESVKGALLKKRPPVYTFFLKEFATRFEAEQLESGSLPDQVIIEFCEFGVQTSKGFQRIPILEKLGQATLVKRKSGSWKLYRI